MHTHGPVLLAGGLADVDFITDYFRRLPPIALHGLRGTVFIEVESQFDISILDVPANIGVHWLVREDIDFGNAEPGLPLVQAVQLWAQEWITEGGDPCQGPQLMWIGCAGTPIVERMCLHLLHEHEDLHLHHADLI
jgi:hypothetical protein